MAVNLENRYYQTLLANAEIGGQIPDIAVLPSRLLAIDVQGIVKASGFVIEGEDKKSQIAYWQSRDKRYLWKLTDAEVEEIDGKVKSIGDLSSGLEMNGFMFAQVATHIKEGILPVRLAPIILPRNGDKKALARVLVSNGDNSINLTRGELLRGNQASEDLYAFVETQSLMTSDQLAAFNVRL